MRRMIALLFGYFAELAGDPWTDDEFISDTGLGEYCAKSE